MQTIKKLKQITNDYDKLKIYQKAYEHLKNINAGFRNILCSNQSEIYKLSGDDKLSYLVEHLIEYRTQQYSIGSIINNNIELLFTISELTLDRNYLSHPTGTLTLEELKFINIECAEELYKYITITSKTL